MYWHHIPAIVNALLSHGRLPETQKHAIISPRLKDSGLDMTDMAHFRPVSNLLFISKRVEKAVARQLTAYLSEHKLLESQQSAWQYHHSVGQLY